MTGNEKLDSLSERPNHRLLCIAGKLTGAEIPLGDKEITFGRTTANDVVVRDPRVSRRHAKIIPRHDSYLLIDLKSQNGTYVNDVVVDEHILRHGDEIRIADHRFIFLVAGEEVMVDSRAPEISVVSDEERGQTITLETRLGDDALPSSVVEDTPAHSTMIRRLQNHLEALHQMTQIMAADVEQPVLLKRICDLLIESFVAERACILLQDPTTGELHPAATAYSDSEDRCDLPLSRTIIEQVRTERSSLLCTDAKSDPRLGRAPSVSSHEIRSVMCVPLIRGDDLLGILYVDNRSMPGEFSEGDLWLLRAMGNQAAVVIENFHLMSSLRRRVEFLEERVEEGEPSLFGESPAIQRVIETGRRAADSNATVLVLGESGTGKEVLARSIHRWSPRRDQPFIVVNCGALAAGLLQSDLFGHEKGAFTGAIKQKKGRLELADGGTVFLDEIGEVDQDLQVKLLRFLQEHEFERVGGTRPLRVDVRVIAATNRNLAEEVRRGRFREDLFYRLRVIEIEMPPLRDRRNDITGLAADLLRECMQQTGRAFRGFSREASGLLKSYDWPGNVRELRNAVERAVVLATGPWIEDSDLSLGPSRSSITLDGSTTEYHDKVLELKRQVIQEALEEADGVQAAAAENLGLTPAYLSRLMKNLGMR